MARKEIIWAIRATKELQNILEFYNNRNGNNKYSLKLLSKIDQHILNLSIHCKLGRLSDNKTTRILVFDVYLIFYEIIGDKIEVLSFWDNRQTERKRIVK